MRLSSFFFLLLLLSSAVKAEKPQSVGGCRKSDVSRRITCSIWPGSGAGHRRRQESAVMYRTVCGGPLAACRQTLVFHPAGDRGSAALSGVSQVSRREAGSRTPKGEELAIMTCEFERRREPKREGTSVKMSGLCLINPGRIQHIPERKQVVFSSRPTLHLHLHRFPICFF